MNAWVKDVTDATFESEVVARSLDAPVVVDFWAPWCAPCRTLGPVLERLAAEHRGEFVVAKVNVDECPRLASEFAVQSIPAVKAIVGGEIVDEFVGALPEPALREFLRRILPSEADRTAKSGDEAAARGDPAAAETLYRRAIGLDPNHPRARLGLGKLLAGRSPEEALAELDRVLPGTPERAEADRIAARLRLAGVDGQAETDLRARIAANPGDLDARMRLARLLAARERYEDALAELLDVVKRDRTHEDDGARKAMLDVFAVLGSQNPITEKYRSELARVLFS